DLTAWYREYCARFEVRPFRSQPTAEELAEAKTECDTALRMLAAAGMVWRYGPGANLDGSAPGGPALGAGSLTSLDSEGSETPGSESRATKEESRAARLERELTILCDKGIAAYFLIVWDFVNW